MTRSHLLPWAVVLVALSAVSVPGLSAAGEAAPPAEVVVTVMGESAHSFEEAKEDALRKAVEMGAGKEVFSDTRIADYALMHDTIVSRAAGYVKGFDILEKKETLGAYSVKVQATVALGQIRDDWGAIQVIIQREGRPNLLVVCTEEIMHYLTGQPLPGTGNIAESKLRNRFLRTEKGDKLFDLIDDETLAKKVGRDVSRAMLARDEDRAVAVAQQLNADFLVIVSAKGRARQERIYGVDAWTVDADLRVKITAADTGVLLADENVSQRRPSEDPTTAAGTALDVAAGQVWPKLLKSILLDWSEKQLDGRKIECVGRRIPTDLHDAIVAGLRKSPDVKQVSTADHNEMLSTDWAFTRLKPADLGRAVERASGGLVRIVAYARGRLEYEMGPPLPPPVRPPTDTVAPSDPAGPATPSSIGQGAGGNESGPPQMPAAPSLAELPQWVLPACISAVAVVLAFVAGILVARRRGRGQAT